MNLDEFTRLTEQESLLLNLPSALQGLWYAKQGDWKKAHQLIQNASDVDSAWVHAYLHRVEGDLDNARYWYRRAGRSEFKADLAQEWEQITKAMLSGT